MDLDEHEVIWDRYREGPFAGLTLAKARIANAALFGYPVRVWNFHELEERDRVESMTPRELQLWHMTHPGHRVHRTRGEVGIFLGITLPGSAVRMLEQLWDVRIATDGSLEEGYFGQGSTRVMGIGAISDLQVVGDEWGWCADCCGWRPRGVLGSRGAINGAWEWADPEERNDPYYADTVCRRSCQ